VDLPERMERNIAEHARQLVRAVPGARYAQRPDVVLCDSGLPDDMANVVLAARVDGAGADRRIAEVAAEVRATGRPFAWCVGPASTPADLSDRLAAAGLPVAERETAMQLPLAGFAPPAPAGLTVRVAAAGAARADFAAVVAANWDPPNESARRLLAALPADGPSTALVGYAGGEPVCTALLVDAAGVSGLYMVCTLAAHRGRGYGTAVTAAALARARHPVAVLQASPLGEPVYRRLGFRPAGGFAEHTVSPAAPG
jgi:GNAT superfamily N-acetyltransferase